VIAGAAGIVKTPAATAAAMSVLDRGRLPLARTTAAAIPPGEQQHGGSQGRADVGV